MSAQGKFRLTGLVAAAYTPMHADGSLNLSQVPAIVDHYTAKGVSGIYVSGSSGEGASLTGAERRAVAESFVEASGGKLPVVIQVGHNSVEESCQLAEHAQKIGATAVSANAPSYFKTASVEMLTACMAKIAAGAPELPFYYYHIPQFTGAVLDMVDFLDQGSRLIPNLAGLKFSDLKVHDYQACLNHAGKRFDVLWGCDEMLLSALVVGARGAVGSTYNIAAPLYRRIIDAFDAGSLEEARRCQLLSVQMVRILFRHAPFHPSMKGVLAMLGLDCGPCRFPQEKLLPEAEKTIRRDLEGIGFFEWAV